MDPPRILWLGGEFEFNPSYTVLSASLVAPELVEARLKYWWPVSAQASRGKKMYELIILLCIFWDIS